MATEFQLPNVAPPGNLFPSRCGTPSQTAKVVALEAPSLKLDTRQIVIAVTAASSVEEIKPPPPARVHDTRPSTPSRAGPWTQSKSEGDEPSRKCSQGGSQPSAATWGKETNNGPDERSPVMRSMFPQMNSSIPLSHQHYYPTLERGPPLIVTSGDNAQYSPSLYSQPRSPPTGFLASDPWAASRIPSTILNASPLRIIEESVPELSSPDSLLDLWSIANGQNSVEAAESYTLGLKCDSLILDHEAFTLTSSSSALYTLHASGSTVVMTRAHPLDPSKEITICKPTLSAPSVIHPELATFFPTLAELLAIDTASNVAATQHLPRQEGIRLQTEALDRARRAEAATLLWDSDSANYYFSLPSLHNPSGVESPPTALSIEIVPDSFIRFVTSTAQPILTLDLASKTLDLQTCNITSLASSIHTLDVLLSSLLTLILHLQRHTALLAPPALPIPHFDPPPTRTSPRSISSRKFTPTKVQKQKQAKPPSRWLSMCNPLFAPGTLRSQSALSHRTAIPPSPNPSHVPTVFTMAVEDKDLEAAWPAPISKPIPPSGVAPELRGSNTGVDLSRFQSFDLDDPDLGGGTKFALRVIYWAFGVVVWVIGVFVGCLAAGIVALGGCAGGKGLSREG